jgi:ABC-type sugar transport system ATPase subunit
MIACEALHLRQGAFALTDIRLQIPVGAYAVLMGDTGCGKTTLLEAILGLRPVQRGRILVGERDVTRAHPGERGIGYVPQDGALFPTYRVREQLAFALVLRHWPTARITARVRALADELGIAHLLDRLPQGLSGGERQRVALGRALAAEPQVLICDEPLSAIDRRRRGELIELLRSTHRRHGVTVLHVTHDEAEADALATLRLHLDAGRIRTST